MYRRAIKFTINKNVQQFAVRVNYRHNFCYSVTTQPNRKDSKLVDDIRESASGLPPTPPSSTNINDRVNVVKTSTTAPSSTSTARTQNNSGGGDMGGYVADTAKQGVAKAIETGLDIGEMAKKTLDNVWDATKDTTHAVKEAVTGDREKEKHDVPPTDRFVDDLRKHADGYDLRKK